nr:regulator of G-protein signaling 22 isoform X2 [Pseudochaenichthys georgianus]
MCGVVSAELQNLTAGNFENSLASDEVLVHFFNDFLSLPSFPEALQYDPQTGQFELVDGAADFVSRRIRSVLHSSKSQLLPGDPTAPARTPPVDNRYTVRCLDREQGIQWIIKERLPFFLLSDCYSEYRLAELLFGWSPVCIHRGKGGSGGAPMSAPQLRCSAQTDQESKTALKVLTCSHSQSNSSAKEGSMRMLNVTCLCSDHMEHLNTQCSVTFRCSERGESPILQGTHTELSLHAREETLLKESSEVQLEEEEATVVKQVLNNALSQADTSECWSTSGEQTRRNSTHRSCEACLQHVADGGTDRLGGGEEKLQEGKKKSGGEEKTKWRKKNREVGRRDRDPENIHETCCQSTCCRGNRQGVDELKEFLRGTSGEKLLNLWMDIERLKAPQNRERKNRYLVLMRSRHLVSSSLSVELLSRLGLTTSPCWTEDRLHSVQPPLTEALLHYWVPRFWTSHCARAEYEDPPPLELWTACGVSPLSDTQPHHGSTTMTPSPHSQLCSGRSQLLDSRRMEKMIQALSADSCAGLYFTHFCEQSGNQLWENAVYFWTDLQHYHELFYQDGLDHYRVQREAQLLYSTYLFSSARRSIGVDEEIRTEVYDQLMPAFEEVFDRVEEHTLNTLLEPWTLLLSRDKESFQKVLMQDEVRRVDSQEYRELQSLYEESEFRLKQVEQSQSILFPSPINPSIPFTKGAHAPNSWSQVSPNLKGYRLGSLLRHHHEIGHFMSFLQNHDASIHLTCWLDLEQYKRTAQRDMAVRQEGSSHIATKYLNRKYFFGSDSPASSEQQNDLLRQAGGLERLKRECLSDPVVVQIQAIIRSHMENTWLPLFLSTAEFTERLRNQPKPQTAGRPSQAVYREARRRKEAWEAGGLWMSSSKEILLFRQTLLHPDTCVRFQHFASLKGDFLEKDVLFWLEVQRYKDLCHSHSDEATIQQKVSTIINCFVNSSMPPALQIDIPPEQAQHLLERRQQLGPYIFREAQRSVFSALLKFWPEFQELSSRVQEEQLLPLLQERRVQHSAAVRRQRRKEEEEEEERKRAQEELERRESAFREEEETDGEDDIEEGQERRNVTKEWRTQSRVLLTPTQPLSWSYSKYTAALRREEVLLRRQSQLGASIPASDPGSSSTHYSSDIHQSLPASTSTTSV